MSDSEEEITFESFSLLTKFEDINEFVEVLLQINMLRKKGYIARSREEIPEELASLRQTLEIKEGQAKRLVHELATLIERHSRMARGEGAELLEEVQEEARNIVKKGLVRLVKSGAYAEEEGCKSYDWRVEKEIGNGSGKVLSENVVFMSLIDTKPDMCQKVDFAVKQEEFLKFHKSLSELREKTLQMLGE